MADIIFEEVPVENPAENPAASAHPSRPSLAQVKAILSFMEKNPDLAKKKHKYNSHSKFKKHWLEIAELANSLEGCVKSSQGWIKFWSDKKRFIMTRQRQIEEGKLKSSLTALEQRILDLCDKKTYVPRKRKKTVKQEPCNGDEQDSVDDVFVKGEDCNGVESRASTDAEDRQLTMIEKMVDVMDQQASAMSQIAQASLTNSKALARLAEASHVQALAVDRLVGTFETIGTSAHDIRNAILGIDYTLKRVYPTTQRQNSTLFS